jgi:hypothetical protein
MSESAQAYLPYVEAKPEVQLKLEDILVVCTYPDVFTEVMGLSLDREVEFAIDLVPRTQPHGSDKVERVERATSRVA